MPASKPRRRAHNPIGPKASSVLAVEIMKDPELAIEISGAREARIKRMIASLVTEARNRGGLSQTAVARKAGMWPAHLSRLESKSSSREPSISLLARVANAMGYKLDLRLVPLRATR